MAAALKCFCKAVRISRACETGCLSSSRGTLSLINSAIEYICSVSNTRLDSGFRRNDNYLRIFGRVDMIGINVKTLYPITFDVRVEKKKLHLTRILAFPPVVLLYLLMWRKDPDVMIAAVWFGAIIIGFALVATAVVRIKNGNNFNQPKFSLYEDKLLVKDAFANIIEYPLESFENAVVIKKQWFEQFIDVPDRKSIHISCLEKADRQKLIDALKVLVETD